MIELLVVVVIIALLIGITLPAIQGARESARRMECINHLKQMGVALQNYEGIHGMFPPSRVSSKWGTTWTTNFFSNHVFILPYIEQRNLFNAINTDFANIESPFFPTLENHTARNTLVSLFICPSDGVDQSLNSYRYNFGRFFMNSGYFDGPFSAGVLPRAATISDGLSSTAFLSERVSGDFVPGSQNPVRNVRSPDPGAIWDSDAQVIAACSRLTKSNEQWSTQAGKHWFYSGFLYTGYNHNGRPNDSRITCMGDVSAYPSPGGLCPPRSFHPNGVNVLFGDGHVRFVVNSIASGTWEAMGTYKSQDIVSE